jgi:mono/diheme cytochrome c family protein
MSGTRSRVVVAGFVVGGALTAAWLFGAAEPATGAPSMGHSSRVPVVTVSAGDPEELGFKLSKSSLLPVGKVTFKVTNRGFLTHDFKVCTKAVKTSAANTCVGKATKRLAAGESATLTLAFTAKGTYEFLCTVPGHASGGMKGLLGIGVKVAAPAGGSVSGSTGSGSTGGTTTTTAGGTGPAAETLVGDPTAGAAVWTQAGCGTCHTLRAAGATGGVGPNLDNSKPGQQIVIQFVTNGTGVMPSFSSQLSVQQIQNLAAYVYRSTH